MKTTTPTRHSPKSRSPRHSEEGYILVAVIFMVALLTIAMAVAAPKVAKSIQRDREIETMYRGKQYARAVKLYYKQFNAYPPTVDALVKTNEIRFLRKKYIDPTTGKDDWKPIHVGQQKTQTLGFFGQPIAGMPVAGIGPSGGNGLSGGSTIGGLGSSGSPGSNSGSTDSGSGTSGSSTDSSSGSGATGGSGSGQTGGTATGGTGTDSSSSSIFGTSGQTFGGAGIMGFSPASPKQSILVYKKKNHYNEWEFLYDPLAEQMMMQGGNTGAIGTPASGMPGSTPIGSGPAFGGGSSTSGGTNFGGTTTTPPSTPQQPQQ